MRGVLFLSLTVVLLCRVAFADHHKDHHDHKDDHHKDHHDHKDDHHKKGDHKHHHHSNESLACHRIANQNSEFAFKLFRQIVSENPSENIVYSPIGIATSLALLLLGARAQTHNQILEVLDFNTSKISENDIHESYNHLLEMLNKEDSELQLNNGNALFIENTRKIQPKFLDDAKNLYHSEAFSTDFKKPEEATKQINDYVAKNTHGLIPELLSTVSQDAALYLVNYIYFKGKWEHPFDEKDTTEGDFHVNENTTVKVPFMTRTGFYNVANNEDAIVIAIPYKGNASSLFIFPKEGKQKDVKENYSYAAIKKWKKSFHRQVVTLSIPKFSISSSLDLKEILSKLGLVDMFTDSADLSGITGAPSLKISKAIHKAVLTVDEKGTEAAGSTALEAIPMSLPLRVVGDHPFMISIYHPPSRSVLFTAKIANPEK
ncbi:alpha-1-antiproteinase-like [Pseudophryne corroboree]|uniref:alpha-1-antiproteinase-like n=1 Tax=Pseudophryne corroboree TaxID=495146 RepID=UPI003081B2DB